MLAGRTIMAVLAHPDDEVLACGGTLARAADAGARVVLVCASRGELGPMSQAALIPDGDLGAARAAELRASAETLGVAEVILLGHPDGCLRWADGLGEEVFDLLERHRPDAVITFDEDGLYWHGDHVGVHERTTLALSRLGPAGPALYYVTLPEGAMRALAEAAYRKGGPSPDPGPWGIPLDAFGAGGPPPTFRVDVREWVPRKLAALLCHATQAGPASPFSWIDEADVRQCLGFEQFRRTPAGHAGDDVLEQLSEAPGP